MNEIRNQLVNRYENLMNSQNTQESDNSNVTNLQNRTNTIFGLNKANNSSDNYASKLGRIGVNRFTPNNILNDSKQSRAQQLISEKLNIQSKISRIKAARANAQSNNTGSYADYTSDSSAGFNANADANNLASLDVATELPKLSTGQIGKIIDTYFSNSKVISSKDAQGIYDAQQKTGMSALAILGIGALESGWGTSGIAKRTNNIWGYGATNKNPSKNAHNYSQMSAGASQFANEYMNTYYNKYGAKSIYSAGTGNNPGKKGYAYNNDGSINTSWATNIGSIMKKLYNTAKSVSATNGSGNAAQSQRGSDSSLVGKRIANTASYNNSAAKGQCVWYVRGRASEKLGKTVGALGNANQMWYNAKDSAKLSATKDNIKPNTIVSYSKGVTSAGQKYGHVIFIEDVVGDTVYYTEGGSSYYKNGTDGVVKTATKEGILNGVNTSGGRMGSGIIGLIDLSKY